MPSLQYKVAQGLITKFGHKQAFCQPEPQMRAFLQQLKLTRKHTPPAWIYARYNVVERKALGSPIYVIKPRRSQSAQPKQPPVVLFVHGGGFMFEAIFSHWMVVDEIVRKTDAEVWFCVYPLLPDYTLYESSDTVFETYLQLLERYDAGRITVIGDSAGATLALNLAHWLNKPQIALPQPKQIILVSPAQAIVTDPDLRAQMDAINSHDIMLNTRLMDTMRALMPVRPGYDGFYEYPFDGDFAAVAPLMVFAGTYEMFYPLVKGFVERLQRSGVQVDYHLGESLCHCYPYVPMVPECASALKQLVSRI